MPRLQKSALAPYAHAARTLGLRRRCKCDLRDFPDLTRRLKLAKAHWIAVRVRNAEGEAIHWLLWSNEGESLGGGWLWGRLSSEKAAAEVETWLHLRGDSDWAASDSVMLEAIEIGPEEEEEKAG